MPEVVERVCAQVALIYKGRIMTADSVERLARPHRQTAIRADLQPVSRAARPGSRRARDRRGGWLERERRRRFDRPTCRGAQANFRLPTMRSEDITTRSLLLGRAVIARNRFGYCQIGTSGRPRSHFSGIGFSVNLTRCLTSNIILNKSTRSLMCRPCGNRFRPSDVRQTARSTHDKTALNAGKPVDSG